MNLFEQLAQTSVFSHLASQEKQHLVDIAIPRTYLAGEWITHYGNQWPYLFVVEAGRVSAEKESSGGRSLIVIDLGPGEIFWGTGFFLDHAEMPVALIAKEDSRIALWSQERMKPVLLQNGQMSWELARLMVQRMQHASDMVEELAFQPVTGRLAGLLLDRFRSPVGEAVARDMTLDEMAAHIGTTREMVCRQLYKFAGEGAIQINRTEFLISDHNHLEKIAGRKS